MKEKPSTQDPDKVFFNFPKYVLSDCGKSPITKGLTCRKLDYANYLVNFA